MRRLVVTIDGPAGAGKSTVAKRLARRLGYRLLDTGAIYRAVALVARRRGIPWDDAGACAGVARDLEIDFAFSEETEQNRISVSGEDVTEAIRAPDMSDGASRVSAHPEVRAALLDLQRRLAAGGGVVVEGRDVGTVVFPHADAKFFLTAAPAVRARRRAVELGAGDDAAIAEEMRRRDERDASRAAAPLRQAPDAILVDSTDRSIDEVVDAMLGDVKGREQS